MTEQEFMLTTILNCERTDLYVNPPQLTPEQAEQLAAMQERRRKNEPLQYILGKTEFMGFTLRTDPRALIPRPETELLVENVLQLVQNQHMPELRVLDVGTGTGNIAIALAKSLTDAKVYSLDISEDALQLARHNARLNDVAHKIDFMQISLVDFFQNYTSIEKRFDIIVSNPPYIKTSALSTLPLDVQQEPVLALDGGEDGLNFYRLLIKEAVNFLKPGGFLACEFGDGQNESLSELVKMNHFAQFYFINDYTGTPRHFIAQV